ncbi:hypothetical protein L1887_22809 [Cichorium endivia]|nr:hypothetical protein L1887_22809 [Cichorium endivia]
MDDFELGLQHIPKKISPKERGTWYNKEKIEPKVTPVPKIQVLTRKWVGKFIYPWKLNQPPVGSNFFEFQITRRQPCGSIVIGEYDFPILKQLDITNLIRWVKPKHLDNPTYELRYKRLRLWEMETIQDFSNFDVELYILIDSRLEEVYDLTIEGLEDMRAGVPVIYPK